MSMFVLYCNSVGMDDQKKHPVWRLDLSLNALLQSNSP